MENVMSARKKATTSKSSKLQATLLGSAVVAMVANFTLRQIAGDDKFSAAGIGSDVAQIVSVGLVITLVLMGNMWRGLTQVQKVLSVITMVFISFSAMADLIVGISAMGDLAEISAAARSLGCAVAVVAVLIGMSNKRKMNAS